MQKSKDNEGNRSVQISDTEHRNFMWIVPNLKMTSILSEK